jgi:hypothetical protein
MRMRRMGGAGAGGAEAGLSTVVMAISSLDACQTDGAPDL